MSRSPSQFGMFGRGTLRECRFKPSQTPESRLVVRSLYRQLTRALEVNSCDHFGFFLLVRTQKAPWAVHPSSRARNAEWSPR